MKSPKSRIIALVMAILITLSAVLPLSVSAEAIEDSGMVITQNEAVSTDDETESATSDEPVVPAIKHDKFMWDNATVYFLLTDRFNNSNNSSNRPCRGHNRYNSSNRPCRGYNSNNGSN